MPVIVDIYLRFPGGRCPRWRLPHRARRAPNGPGPGRLQRHRPQAL